MSQFVLQRECSSTQLLIRFLGVCQQHRALASARCLCLCLCRSLCIVPRTSSRYPSGLGTPRHHHFHLNKGLSGRKVNQKDLTRPVGVCASERERKKEREREREKERESFAWQMCVRTLCIIQKILWVFFSNFYLHDHALWACLLVYEKHKNSRGKIAFVWRNEKIEARDECGVVINCRLPKNISFFCKRALQKRPIFSRSLLIVATP